MVCLLFCRSRDSKDGIIKIREKILLTIYLIIIHQTTNSKTHFVFVCSLEHQMHSINK